MVKTWTSDGAGVGSIPGGELRSHMPHSQKTHTHKNHKNRSDIVTHSIKTLKMVHIKKIF